MKANELMIGDKVMVKVLSQIPDTYVLHTWTATDYSRDIQVKPIPLTPEILEKNGFYDRNTQGYYAQWYYKRFGSYVCFDIAISLVYKEIEVSKVCGAGTDCEEEEYGSSIVFSNDICVHTLQHALRLCGLDELADNFKI